MMMTTAEIGRLLRARSAGPSVLSVYVRAPLDPPALRDLPARVDELIASARRGPAQDSEVAKDQDEARHIARRLLEVHARQWLGHTVAIFACGEPQLAETFVLPGAFEDRAVFAARPHVRPLLLALQRFPRYCVAIVDGPRAWAFRVTGDRIDKMTPPVAGGAPGTGFGGWYALESRRAGDHVARLTCHSCRDTAAALGAIAQSSGTLPLVAGGRPHDVSLFLAELTDDVRDQVVGSFAVDPHTVTPSRARELAGQVIARSVSARERRLVTELAHEPHGGLTAIGVQACLDAVNQRAAKLLVVPEREMIPGFVCQRCGMLSSTGTDCQDWGAATVAVPDLIEEMVLAAIRNGAQAEATSDPPGGIAARLLFPLATWNAQSA
jgi:Bacterial archaeo-eukaryotic release factor family 10